MGAVLLAACEQKQTTVNPTTEKKETDTTIVKEKETAPTETKTENDTSIKLQVASPAPSP
jgi:hypothetical protein